MPRWLSRSASSDDGLPVAQALGLEVVRLERGRSKLDADEIYLFAAAPGPTELVFHSMGRSIGERGPAVVFTGYHGDKLWDVHTAGKYLRDDIRRGDTSGLTLGEFRLKSGFVNVAVPFIFARSVQSLNAVAKSAEMAPWRLGNSYDRPIARRIVETAGVPRAAFGMRKQAVVTLHRYPGNAKLRRDYLAFVRGQCGIGPGILRLQQLLDGAASRLSRVADYARAVVGGRRLSDPMFAYVLRTRREFFWKRVKPARLLYYWAVSRLSERAARALRDAGVTPLRSSLASNSDAHGA